MRIAVVGSGALGGFYGALLARRGYDVHFLMRRDYETVKRRGLTVRSCKGDFHLDKVNCYNDAGRIGTVDLVFVGLKTTSNDHYPELISPLMGADSTVMSAQNGLDNDERLAQLFGTQRVAGAVAFLCSNRQQPGVINHLDYGFIHIGNYQRGPDEKLRQFAQMFNDSGVDCKVIDDLTLARWKKLVWNIPFNGLSALLDKTTDALMSDGKLRQQVECLMKEVQAAAQAYGLIIEDEFLAKMMSYTEKMTPYYSSMHLDRRQGRQMEVESIIGAPLRQGQARGIKMPQTQRLYEQLKKLDQVN